MRFELYLARRYLFRGKAKHISFIGIISCVGLILGVAALIIAFSVVNGTDGTLIERIMKFKDHLIVDSFNKEDLNLIKEELNDWQDIDVAYLWLQTQIFAKFDNTIMPLVVKGIDFNDPKAKQLFYQYVEEELGEEGFFIGEGIRRRFLPREDLEFYPLEKKLKLKKEKVRGFFKVGLYDVDNYFLIYNLEEAKNLSPNYSLLLGVKIKDPFKAEIVKDKINKRFPKDVYVSTWIETNQAIFSTLKLEKLAMFIILSLIIIVASFNIFATLTIKVVEKIKDIGILRSIGFTSKNILTIFTLQGLIMGFIGVLGGSILGIGICELLKKYPFIKVPEEIFGTEYLPIVINYTDVVLVALAGLLIAFVSSLIPAFRGSRLVPSEALRYE